MSDIRNFRVIVSGSTGGIGLAVANGLFSRGAEVIAFGRSKRPLSLNKGVAYINCDLESEESTDSLIEFVKKEFQSINSLINVAGISLQKTQSEKTRFEKTINLNLIKTYELILKFLPLFGKSSNSIVNISSINSVRGFPNNPGYVASKSGLSGLTRALSVDLFENKIRVNTISPGYFHTNLTKNSFENQILKNERSNRTVMGRWGELLELVGPVAFLISDDSSYMTGQELFVDGGWTIKGL